MRKALAFIVPIAAGFIVGFLSAAVQAESIRTWYPMLDKSPLTPPDGVFSIVWSTLYVLSGVSMGIILLTSHRLRSALTGLFAAQLLLNFLWCLFFFYLQSPAPGLIIILVLEALLITYTVLAFRVNTLSGILFIPYVLWVGFASYLNLYILINN